MTERTPFLAPKAAVVYWKKRALKAEEKSTQPKARIKRIGEIWTNPEGGIIWRGWMLDGENRDLTGVVYDAAGKLRFMGGWSLSELHTIAHGFPCLKPGCLAESASGDSFEDTSVWPGSATARRIQFKEDQ